MKKILLLLLAVFAVSCAKDRPAMEAADLQGQWKSLQEKISKKTPLHDVSCKEGSTKWKGDIYTFNADGSFTTTDICSGKRNQDVQKGTWSYEDHILTLQFMYKDKEAKYVYSVSDLGNDKVKWRMVYSRQDYNYMELRSYYLIMQKQ